MPTPDHSPLIANDLVCSKCGTVLKPKVVMGPRGVACIEYQCTNKETQCAYKLARFEPVSCEMVPVRDDGSPVKL